MIPAGLEEKHKFATRWFHWINFPILSAMIFSGLLIYWANDIYRIGFGDCIICFGLLSVAPRGRRINSFLYMK